jgi:NAD(P)-dependent dehydrogenase (short-subunit alcohol dehydrogenase family)
VGHTILFSACTHSHTHHGVPDLTSTPSSFAVPELVKTKGQIVVVSSAAAQIRIPCASDYCVSKHAIHRLAEFVAVGKYLYCGLNDYVNFLVCLAENPDIKVFCVHPGAVATEGFVQSRSPIPASEAIALPAATMLYLTSGKADYLSGRYVSATWDLGEVERDWKEKIITQQVLVNKLSIPQ